MKNSLMMLNKEESKQLRLQMEN